MRWPWFRKSLDLGPVIVIFMFSKMQKSVVFFVLTALLVRWDLAFAGSFCRLLLYGSATAFSCFLNNKFQDFFIITISHAHTCLLKNVRFYLISGAFEE